ncbi:Neurotransmitter-gated ion-channel ligand binding domain family protein [Acanthocheilonema viteae]
MLSLLLLLLNDCSCNDTPFVINRITNQIEFSELLLGYNYNYADNRSMKIPKDIKIWKPDTNFFESVTKYGAESLRLYTDGTICWKQQATLTFPCISNFVLKQSDLSALNCSLIIGSFDNSGMESIIYEVGDIILPSNLMNPLYAILAMNHTITTFEEVALNGESMIQTVIHFLIESDQIISSFNRTEL